MGYPELLRVIEGEAAREARELSTRALAERERILAEARSGAARTGTALAERARAEAAAAALAGREALEREREQALLVARHRALEAVRAGALEAFLAGGAGAEAGDAALVARLLGGLAPELEGGPAELAVDVIVDPGAAPAARAALARLGSGLLRRAIVLEAPARRGGVEVVAGRRVLDDTLPARLERAWAEAEPVLAARLFEPPATEVPPPAAPARRPPEPGAGPCPGSTT